MQLHIRGDNTRLGMEIALSGAVTFSESDELEIAILLAVAAGPTHLKLDVQAVTTVDSVGLGILAVGRERVEANGGTFCLTGTGRDTQGSLHLLAERP